MSSDPPSGGQGYRLEVERVGQAAVARLSGSVSMDVSEELRDELIELIHEPVDTIVLEMSGLEFICSLGLSGIIAAHLHCRHHNRSIRLVAPAPAIRELLTVTRLTTLLPLYEDVPSALAGA